jgi:hypothetical protein
MIDRPGLDAGLEAHALDPLQDADRLIGRRAGHLGGESPPQAFVDEE